MSWKWKPIHLILRCYTIRFLWNKMHSLVNYYPFKRLNKNLDFIHCIRSCSDRRKIDKTGHGLLFRLNNFNEQFIICQHRRTRQVASFLACKRDLYFVLKSMFAAVKWVKYKLHRSYYTSLSKNYAVGRQIKWYLSIRICLCINISYFAFTK